MNEAEYLSYIEAADRDLLASARLNQHDHGCEVLFDEALAWPGALGGLLHKSTEAELVRIQYAIERHYANRLKATDDTVLQDELLALAYLRVVYLQFLRREPEMGFTEGQLRFVLAAIKHFRSAEGRDPCVLEVGCGSGSLLVSLAQSGLRSIAGIDLSPAAVGMSRDRLAAYGLAESVQQATIPQLIRAGAAKCFDVIIMCDVLEHVPPARTISLLVDAHRILRDDGYLIVVTPNSFAGPHDITRYFQAPGSAPEGLHLHEYSLRELTGLLSQAGFGHFSGLQLRNCIGWPSEPFLSSLSVRVRLAIERFIPYAPSSVGRRAVNRLYFSAICARALSCFE